MPNPLSFNLSSPLLRMLLPLVATALTLGGCASNTTISSTWHDQKMRNARYENVVVVGVSENTDSRMSFEDAVVYDLRSPDTKAWSSSRHMPAGQEINKSNVRQLVLDKNADAIIVTKITQIEVVPVMKGGRTDVMEYEQETGAGMLPDTRANAYTTPIFRRDETVEPTYMETEYNMALTTDVYSAATGELVYSASSTAKKQKTKGQLIDVLSDVIAKRLRADGVIR
jgi:hypothetical protein